MRDMIAARDLATCDVGPVMLNDSAR